MRFALVRPLATLVPLVLGVTLAVALPAATRTPTQVATRPADFVDHAPFATVTSTAQHPGTFTMAGSSFDPDWAANGKVTITAYLDKRLVASTVADRHNVAFGRSHPVAGPDHGFVVSFPVAEGTHSICLWARNFGPGTSYRFGCMTRAFHYGPVGAIDSIGPRPGQVYVQGFAYDDDDLTAALRTTVTVDGVAHVITADLPRPDRAAVLHGGIDHGFAIGVPAAQGAHVACTSITNIGLGTDLNLGCRSVVVNDSPRGLLQSVQSTGGRVWVRGWAVDPDSFATPVRMLASLDGAAPVPAVADVTRPDFAAQHPGESAAHGFQIPLNASEGVHRLTLTLVNVGAGSNVVLVDQSVTVSYAPTIVLTRFQPNGIGAVLVGRAVDPDTAASIPVQLTVDGAPLRTVVADGSGNPLNGHWFGTRVALPSGTHMVCAYAVNVLYGTHNSAPQCNTFTATMSPVGQYLALTRTVGGLAVSGWSADTDAPHAAVTVTVTVDGTPVTSVAANTANGDVATVYPDLGPAHGFATSFAASDGEHTVCVTARNIGAGTDASLGCRLIIAVHPVAPSAPLAVRAVGQYGAATVTWLPPASDGGAPPASYLVTSVPDGRRAVVSGNAATATIGGLRSSTVYRFSVAALNVAGYSRATAAPLVRTQATPPPQTSPAPVSTSRYIRNIRGSTPAELATMRAEGVTDAQHNPSGHGYLVLLDIGGQYGNGVLLSATTRYVAYTDLVRDIQAYVDGYHSAQLASAPVTIAIGTNNDINVSAASGRDWADKVVDPVRAWAARYPGINVAGANDIEPGFNAGYAATQAWLSAYLGATSAQFVFNGSADGCAWTIANRGCNNGWSMYGLYRLAAGTAPTRIVNLPQIYNTTMAAQWKYISLTGVAYRQPRIVFGGPLTEWTACDQSGSCGSMSGRSAWASLWANLQSDTRLRVSSLPYSTDLRVDS